MINTYRTAALTLDGSTDQTLELKGNFTSAAVQFPSSSSLQVKYSVSYDGGTTYEPIFSWDATGLNTPANTADVIAAGDIAMFPCPGATHIKVARTAGSGTAIITASEAECPAVFLPNLLYSQSSVVAGDTLTDPTVKTAFAATTTIPANTLRVGDVLYVEFHGFFDFTGATTIAWELAVGSSTFAAGASASCSGDTRFSVTYRLVVTAVGSSGTVNWDVASTGFTTGSTAKITTNGATGVTLDTTAANAVTISVTNGSSNAANTVALTNMVVRRLRA